jgi:hypothetical protein
MTNAGKAALYLRSILEELHLEQLHPTKIALDNRGAWQLTNAQQPTGGTRHIDMHNFCILQWTEEEQILYSDILSAYNVYKQFTQQGRIKFCEQMDIPMGPRQPAYASTHIKPSKTSPNKSPDNSLDNPASPYHQAGPDTTPQIIIGSTCCLSNLSIYIMLIFEILNASKISTMSLFWRYKCGEGDRDD